MVVAAKRSAQTNQRTLDWSGEVKAGASVGAVRVVAILGKFSRKDMMSVRGGQI
jgi:hypothetical protein